MATPKTIQSTVGFTDPSGALVASGHLTFTLSQPAEVISGGGLVDVAAISTNLTALAVIPGAFLLWGNDQLNPAGTTYRMKLTDSNNNLVADFGQVSLTGASPIDVSQLIPAASSGGTVSYPNPVLQTPSAAQTITGFGLTLSSSAPLTANGNLAAGNVALKVGAATDGVIFLSSDGNDSNDGLSWGSAKATLQAAITATPSAGGTVYFTGTIAQNAALTLKSNLNIIGTGSAQIDSVTGPATITSTLGSGDLFYFNAFNDCRLSDFSIKYTGSGANSAIRLTAAQRNTIERIYISGPFLNPLQLDSSATAPASCIWNIFKDIHTTGTAASGVGLLIDSKDASAKVINSNFFYNVRTTGGNNGAGIRLKNSGVHNQVINENVFFATEVAGATGTGTGLLVDQGSTRGCVFIDCNIEANQDGLNKATANTLTFVGGNISSNAGTNVIDAQPLFTQFFGTNVGGIVQNFAITPIGNVYVNGLSVGGAAPVTNQVTGTTGWQIAASGSAVATVNNTSFELAQNLIFDAGKLITQYAGIATTGAGVPAEFAAVDLAAQTAAISPTTLYAVPAASAGQYRVTWNAKVTTVAGASSTLGPLTIVYTDPDSVVQTITAPASIAAGTIATSSTVNTTATVLLGMPLLLNCKAVTNITYAMAYASNLANVMAYNLHIKLEAL